MNNLYRVDRQRWSRFTLFEQMGNIGSEVGRALLAKGRGNEAVALGATARALDLFEATADCLVDQKSPKLKELLRSKDQFLRLIYDHFNQEEATRMEKYFMNYAIAARAGR